MLPAVLHAVLQHDLLDTNGILRYICNFVYRHYGMDGQNVLCAICSVDCASISLQCALSPVVTLWMDHFGWQRLSHLPRPSLPYFNHAPVTLVSILCSCHTLAYVTFVFPAHANNSYCAIILPDLDTSNDL